MAHASPAHPRAPDRRGGSIVRNFAYASGPAYGLLLDALAPGWRARLRPGSDLGALLASAGGITPDTTTAGSYAGSRSDLLHGAALCGQRTDGKELGTMDRVEVAAGIMNAFGERTGVTSAAAPRRYLWTDAFAVCNDLGLHQHTGEAHWLDDARTLIDQVHDVLGRHRSDDARTGRISGLDEEEGSRHPTAGGLRIGKPLPERRPGERADARLDWERDGQYYHYLTRWMHSLDRAATALRQPELRRLGVELAAAAHAAFAHGPAGDRRLFWKMSIDLSRPEVASMGEHDALDGLIAGASLAAHGAAPQPALATALYDLARMCAGRGWATADALGLGLLLTDALFLAEPALAPFLPGTLCGRVLHDAARSLDLVALGRAFDGPADERLAFRELGLSLGLAAVQRLEQRRREGLLPGGQDAGAALDRLLRHTPLRQHVESFWLDPANQATDAWKEHEDINAVMLATSVLPDGYLG